MPKLSPQKSLCIATSLILNPKRLLQLETMERRVTTSVAEADACEAKVDLMEGVLAKLKVGTQEVYGLSQCGATPVLNLLGDQRRATQGGAPRSMQPEQGTLYSGFKKL